MNLLLVDDEALSVKLLRDSIDWSAIGIENIFCAYNAFQAKQIIHQNPITICVCDIEMPQENGLQLINWIYGHDPGIINIILTGHPEFSYARDAISLGVFRFVIKPVAAEEMCSIIHNAVEKVNQNKAMEKQRRYGEYLLINARSEANAEQWLERVVAEINHAAPNTGEQGTVVEKIKHYISKHYMEDISSTDIEGLVFLNRDHISRILKKHVGFSIMEYLQYYRITVAKRLLRETAAPIGQVAALVGYGSSAYFSKLFKKWTDMTPVDYRSSHLDM